MYLAISLLPLLVIAARPSTNLAAQEEIPKGLIAEFPSILKSKPLEPSGGDEIESLMKARFNAALGVTTDHWVKYARGRSPDCTSVVGSGRRLMQAGMDLKNAPQEKLAVSNQMLEFSEKLEAVIQRRGGGIDVLALKEVLEFRIEVNIERVKLEKAMKKPPPKKAD
jgi:hypothetical protein